MRYILVRSIHLYIVMCHMQHEPFLRTAGVLFEFHVKKWLQLTQIKKSKMFWQLLLKISVQNLIRISLEDSEIEHTARQAKT
jgi:hypothetical protein